MIKKIATWLNLDIRVKPEYDNIGADTLVKFENDSICTGRSMVENVLQLIKYNSPKLYYTCVKTTNNGECTSPMLTNTNIDKVNQSDIYDYCNLCKTSGNCRISSQFSFD